MIAWQGQKRLDFVYFQTYTTGHMDHKGCSQKIDGGLPTEVIRLAGFTGKSFHASVLDPRAL